ncbi:MAG: NUDIX domain-containing protein, partial [Actinomycetota bacterium]
MSPGPRIRVAGLLVNGGRVLLVRQEKDGRAYWLLPGGGVEEGEELVDALRRELAEECGWEPTAITGPVALVETIPPAEAAGGRHILHMIFAVEV